jgi:AraC-like DNA-binding protein
MPGVSARALEKYGNPLMLPGVEQPHASDLPELAFRASERIGGLDVSCHDLQGILWRFLHPSRFAHNRPPCSLVKVQRQAACTAFDVDRLRPFLARHPGGLLKRCHAGIGEWVVPVHDEGGGLWAVLFAGPRLFSAEILPTLSESVPPGATTWGRSVRALPTVDAETAGAVLEILRQLATRLERWRRDDLPRLNLPPRAGRSRRDEIRAWIQQHHAEDIGLADLAAHLRLSLDRAGHAVSEACGDGFIALLNRERLRTAADLLRRTDLPVREVVGACGFRNRAHFHQSFRAAMGLSPAQWRRQAEG